MRKARKAEQKKLLKKSCTKHGFDPERSAEEATYDHALLHKQIKQFSLCNLKPEV
jgi:hypothetical protein